MSEQPEALRLADCLERDCDMNWPDYDNQMNAASELRRLHEENARLAAEVANRNRRALEGDAAVDALANVHSYYEGLRYEAASLRDQNSELDRRLAEMEQAGRQALEALEYANTGNRRPEIIGPAITALREALGDKHD